MRHVLASAFAILLACGVASAAEPELEHQYRAALDLRARGEDRRALTILREIEAKAPSGRSLAQVALAEQALGDWTRAEADLLAALRRDGPWITRHRAALEGALTTIQKHLGSLDIVHEGAEGVAVRASIDGAEPTTLPLQEPLRLELGRHRLWVQAEGHLEVVRDVEIAAGKLTREHVRLAPLPSAIGLAAPSSAPSTPTPSIPSSPSGSATTPEPSHPVRSSTMTLLGLGALGLGATSLGAAPVLALVSNGAANEYNADPTCGEPTKPSRCSALRAEVDTYRTFALGAGITGAALVATGIAILIVSSPSKPTVTLLPDRVRVVVRF